MRKRESRGWMDALISARPGICQQASRGERANGPRGEAREREIDWARMMEKQNDA